MSDRVRQVSSAGHGSAAHRPRTVFACCLLALSSAAALTAAPAAEPQAGAPEEQGEQPSSEQNSRSFTAAPAPMPPAAVDRLARAQTLIDLHYPRPHFDLSLELSDEHGFLTPDQRFDIIARSDRSAFLLLLNIDETGTVSVLYPIHDRELRATTGLRETFQAVPPYGTEYLKLFAFRQPPAGLSRWLERRVDALDPEFDQLVRMLAETAGGAETRLEVVTLDARVGDDP